MRTQVVVATTAYGLATVAAALDAGVLAEADRRIVVLANTAAMPEATTPLRQVAGVEGLLTRFAGVYDYNADIEPHHPSMWTPRTGDLPLWERTFRRLWGLGDDEVTLVLESIQVSPARTLGRVFADARIEVYADGLMSYGPTRNRVPESMAHRVERLVHLDLVPGLRPLLLTELEVPAVVVPLTAFRRVVAGMTAPVGDTTTAPRAALVLGQYLAALGLVSQQEETELYAGMVAACAAAGHRRVVFKPHPSALLAHRVRLGRVAAEHGIELELATEPELAEAWFERGDVALVVGCFSTALLTARTGYQLPVARYGTELLLERLTPYQNSNRMPVTIVDALLPDLRTGRAGIAEVGPRTLLAELTVAVGYVMQPGLLAARRGEAVDFLRREPGLGRRYVKRRRLTRLDLPGALPPVPPVPVPAPVRRRATTFRRLVRRVRRRVLARVKATG